MSDLEIERDCPVCGNDTFYLAASMLVHLGKKTKWHCTECDYGYIHITDDVETYVEAEA
ncbi:MULTISPECIES: DUF7838 family putative zinc beta-ribbon protein [Haloferax]|uniref:DUF7838 domain-containing protein n=1 Tax=Haloferax mediterranei (strain ATCC 33500 / DSM 1411 / JCM 8866 / NBRC 14739 / NCIMB 2177 / R-4) TaxID=523841 RepID=I3R781_HALMT|nr:hypothetical protein [Haloferax mediterranei]AFK20091.1 hypothetical protein HFX_2406 [Haloferax mediterranei ATCC 33500]ELZ99638.1 hypothetical protein C439_13829 [Haloferax mediterranei ATCC 33500]MDX5987159.1 hypothetical protein [Haloferax mediterranei ATCC 33500]